MYPYLHIFGTAIPVYFLFLSLVFTLIVPVIVKRAELLKLSPHFALDLYIFVLLGSFVGARAFYILYQEPSFYYINPEQVLYFWNGGYVFFGGFLGSVAVGTGLCLYRKESIEQWFNFSIVLLSLGYAVGRFACFLSGCCYGEETDVLWSIFLHGAERHPTQIYASLMEFFVLAVLLILEKKKGFRAFLVLPVWLILHSVGRVLMEVYRADPRGDQILGLSVSTLISAGLILFGLGLLVYKLYFQSKCTE